MCSEVACVLVSLGTPSLAENDTRSRLRSDKSLQFFNQFQFLQKKLSSLIEESKNHYYTGLSHKLLDLKTSQKSYWSILKTFLNNKKIPRIPPLLHQDKFVADFKENIQSQCFQ